MFEDFMKKLRKGISADESTDIPSFPTYEEVEPMTNERNEKPEEVKKPAAPIVANSGDSDGNIELKVLHPASLDDITEIADFLLDGCTVVLNLEMLDNMQVTRMLDFLNGVTYSTGGEIKNVAKNTYIITPNNVDISADE